jgi:hypothetical protein
MLLFDRGNSGVHGFSRGFLGCGKPGSLGMGGMGEVEGLTLSCGVERRKGEGGTRGGEGRRQSGGGSVRVGDEV